MLVGKMFVPKSANFRKEMTLNLFFFTTKMTKASKFLSFRNETTGTYYYK